MQMHKNKSIIILLVLVSVLLVACSPGDSTLQQPAKTPGQSEVPKLPEIPKPPAELPVNRVEVAYFHMPQRCATCICFGERADYVVRTYFQDELVSGKLTFQIYAIGNRASVEVVKKYNALGSQLFVNMVTNNADHIKDIQDIWDWHCSSDKPGFDDKVKTVIRQCLDAVR
jgi:hypothetical protein